jgi:hypothetical protein
VQYSPVVALASSIAAARVARELEQDSSDYFGCSICIANEQGKELDRVSIGADVIKVD